MAIGTKGHHVQNQPLIEAILGGTSPGDAWALGDHAF